VLYGGRGIGLATDHEEVLTENTIDAGSDIDSTDRFGATLATGDYDDDNKEDAAIGVPEQLVADRTAPIFAAGEIDIVVYGSNPLGFGGLNENRAQAVTENTPGIVGKSEATDRFGSALADLPP
jgi:hypothetical protein